MFQVQLSARFSKHWQATLLQVTYVNQALNYFPTKLLYFN